MKNLRENKGITLIALIITIVVLLIIAGISISGGITGIEEANDNRTMTELEKVQHAITQRYSKFELTKDTSLIVGTKIDDLPTIPTPTGETKAPTWKVFQVTSGATVSTHPERKYYRLSQSDLQNLGLTGSENGSSYIVNYYSGEIFDENKKQTSKGTVLYKTAMENEASELGDEYIKDGMQVWYDGINNTGSGHSNSTTTWYDLSGNNNHATIYNIATTPTADSGWHSNYLALDGVDDFASKTDILVDGANGTIEMIAKWNSGLYLFRSDASGNRTYITGKVTTKGNPAVPIVFVTNNFHNLSSRVLKYYTEKETSYTMNYYNMVASGEPQIYQTTNNGNYISIGSFLAHKWEQGSKMQVFAVRVYNRGLSEAEIHHNYILDKARYGIEE
ncbi:MAG: hypothetical protein IJJ82_01100 [Clostridia bacterium]|nr:hypothetical protein [Clostridia bacterium]